MIKGGHSKGVDARVCYVPSAVSKYSRSGLSQQVLSVTDILYVIALLLVERRGSFYGFL